MSMALTRFIRLVASLGCGVEVVDCRLARFFLEYTSKSSC